MKRTVSSAFVGFLIGTLLLGVAESQTNNFTIVNAWTGYRYNSTATSGQYLRGNGTNFVGAGLNVSDAASGTLALARGGTNASSWTASRCVRVNDDGTALEVASGDCSAASGDITVVGDCSSGACFQTAAANQVFAGPNGSVGVATIRELVDADVPDTITLTNITQVTNRAISDTTGTLAVARGGTNLTASADDNVIVGNGTTWETKAIADCDTASTSKLLYDTTTNAFSCGTDQNSGGGGGSGMVMGDAIANFPTTGSLLIVGTPDTLAQDNTNLFWDDTNDRLGLGTNVNLTERLNVFGNLGFVSGAGVAPDARISRGAAGQFLFGTAASFSNVADLGSSANPVNDIFAGGTLTLSAFTAGSVPYAGTGGLISQANANFYFDPTAKTLWISSATAPTSPAVNRTLSLQSDTGAVSGLEQSHFQDATTGPSFISKKARGTPSVPTIVSANDAGGTFSFQGYDGSAYRNMAQLIADVDTTTGASDMPGRLRILTTPDGSASPVERIRFNNAGDIIFGRSEATTSATSGLLRAPAKTGTNGAGVDLQIQADGGTGTGTPGKVILLVAAPGASGSTANTETAAFTFQGPSGVAAALANGLTFTGAIAAGTPTLAATGSDTNIGLTLVAKGTGAITLKQDSTTLGTWDSNGLAIEDQTALRLHDTAGSEYVALKSPSALGALYTLTFPDDDGTANQQLTTDGSGVLSWVSHLPLAGGTLTGILNAGRGATASGEIRILEDTDDGSNYASFIVPALAANTAYTLPADDGDAGEQLQTNGSGVLTWEAAGGGGGGTDYTVFASTTGSSTVTSGDFFALSGKDTPSSTEHNDHTMQFVGGTFSNLHCAFSASAGGGNSYVVTLRNDADTAVVCDAGTSNFCDDTTHSESPSASGVGSRMNYKFTSTGSPPSTTVRCTVRYANP